MGVYYLRKAVRSLVRRARDVIPRKSEFDFREICRRCSATVLNFIFNFSNVKVTVQGQNRISEICKSRTSRDLRQKQKTNFGIHYNFRQTFKIAVWPRFALVECLSTVYSYFVSILRLHRLLMLTDNDDVHCVIRKGKQKFAFVEWIKHLLWTRKVAKARAAVIAYCSAYCIWQLANL